MSDGTAIIRKLRLDARVSSHHPAPESARLKLADAVERDLSTSLSRALSLVEGDGVLLIRKLVIDLSVDLALPGDRIAALLASAIAQALDGACRSSGGDVVLFPDKAAYLAAYLTARLDGDCDRWWLKSFYGLAMLPQAAACRTAILADAPVGQAALLQLPVLTRRRLFAALSESEAARIADELADQAGVGPAFSEAAPVVVQSLAAMEADMAVALSAGQLALCLYLDAISRQKGLAGRATLELVRAALALRQASQARNKTVTTAVLSGDLKVMTAVAGAFAPALLPLFSLPPQIRRQLVAGIDGLSPVTDGVPTLKSDLRPRYTPFGGLAMLLPMLLDLAVAEIVEVWPKPHDNIDATQLVRFLILCAAGGERLAEKIYDDPFWRDLFGIDPAFGIDDLMQWTRKVPRRSITRFRSPYERPMVKSGILLPRDMVAEPRMRALLSRAALAVLSTFARRLPGFSASSPEFIWRNLLDVPARIDTMDGEIRITIGRPPLDVLLGLTSVARARGSLPDGRRFVLERGS